VVEAPSTDEGELDLDDAAADELEGAAASW
jgi:hypothetical protein